MNTDIDVGQLAADLRPLLDGTFNGKKKVNLVTVRSWALTDSNARQEDVVLEEQVRVPGEDQLMVSADKLADKIYDACHKFAKNIGGLVRFSIKLYTPGKEGNAIRTLGASIYVDSTTSLDLDSRMGIGELSGTERGEKQADLRHREAMARIYIGGTADTMKELREENKSLRAELRAERAAYLRLVQIGETALTQQTLRDRAIKSADIKDELLYQLFGKVSGNLHLIFQYLAGRGDAVVNLGENQHMEALRGFYNSLDEQKRQMVQKFIFDFGQSLDAGQQSIVFRVVEDLQKANIREASKKVDEIGSSMPSMQSAGGTRALR